MLAQGSALGEMIPKIARRESAPQCDCAFTTTEPSLAVRLTQNPSSRTTISRELRPGVSVEISQWRKAAAMQYQLKINLHFAEKSIDARSRAPVKPPAT
jgi:hypothetical protein